VERIQRVLKHPIYIEHMEAITKAEADRIFCLHNMSHFLDVARIAVILRDEEKIDVPKEWIYAAALLHDIGRDEEYRRGIRHEVASAEIAPQILTECGFDNKETDVIIGAISHHRDKSISNDRDLNGLLYRADKASRPCFFCPVEEQCRWSADKKNKELVY